MADDEVGRGGEELLCPSAPAQPESLLIGIVSGVVEDPRIIPTVHTIPVTPEITELAGPVAPTEVFRFAAPCRETCIHFKNSDCQIAARSTVVLEEVADHLPKCPIRAQCRWFHQEGAGMCRRCPQIVTKQHAPSVAMLQIVNHADPPSRSAAPEATEFD